MAEKDQTETILESEEGLEGYSPHGLAVYITNQCFPGGCEHCILSCSVSPPEGIHVIEEPSMLKAIDEARDAGLDTVYFPGGEPFLHFDILLKGVRRSFENGLNVSVETNGIWAQSLEKARNCLDAIGEIAKDFPSNLLIISISLDEFHEKHIPFENLAHVVRAHFEKPDTENMPLSMHQMNTPNTSETTERFLDTLEKVGEMKVGYISVNGLAHVSLVEQTAQIKAPDLGSIVKGLIDRDLITIAQAMQLNDMQFSSLPEAGEVLNAMIKENTPYEKLGLLEQTGSGYKCVLIIYSKERVFSLTGNDISLCGKAANLRKDEEFMRWYKENAGFGVVKQAHVVCIGPDSNYYVTPGHANSRRHPIAPSSETTLSAAIEMARQDVICALLSHGLKDELLPFIMAQDPELGEALSDETVSWVEFGHRVFEREDLVDVLRKFVKVKTQTA